MNHADGRSWAQASGRDEAKNAWRYDRLIYSSIALSVILRKSKEFRYVILILTCVLQLCNRTEWTLCGISSQLQQLIFVCSCTYRYTCLEEYETDCNTLVHNVAVYFGSNAVNHTTSTGKFHEGFIHDIKVCCQGSCVCDLSMRLSHHVMQN